MEKELVTVDSILDYLQSAVENKMPIPPAKWLDASAKLNVLLGAEDEEMYRLKQVVAQKRLDIFNGQQKRNVSAAKIEIEASDEYRTMMRQDARIKRIEEFIRIAKAQARLSEGEWKT